MAITGITVAKTMMYVLLDEGGSLVASSVLIRLVVEVVTVKV